jgi:hypothetical protein
MNIQLNANVLSKNEETPLKLIVTLSEISWSDKPGKGDFMENSDSSEVFRRIS